MNAIVILGLNACYLRWIITVQGVAFKELCLFWIFKLFVHSKMTCPYHIFILCMKHCRVH